MVWEIGPGPRVPERAPSERRATADAMPDSEVTLALVVGGAQGVGKTEVVRNFVGSSASAQLSDDTTFFSVPLPPLGSSGIGAQLVLCDGGLQPERLKGDVARQRGE